MTNTFTVTPGFRKNYPHATIARLTPLVRADAPPAGSGIAPDKWARAVDPDRERAWMLGDAGLLDDPAPAATVEAAPATPAPTPARVAAPPTPAPTTPAAPDEDAFDAAANRAASGTFKAVDVAAQLAARRDARVQAAERHTRSAR